MSRRPRDRRERRATGTPATASACRPRRRPCLRGRTRRALRRAADARRVPSREPRREAVQQQIGGTRGSCAGGAVAHGLDRVLHAVATVEPAGEDRRRQRLEIGLTGQRGVERLETAGRREQQRRSVPASVAREGELCAQAFDPRPAQVVQRPISAVVSSADAVSGAPASNFAWAAASARAPRRAGRASARPPAPGTPRQPRPRRVPEPGRRSARAPRRPPRPGPWRRGARCQARRSGSSSGRSPRPAPDAPRVDPHPVAARYAAERTSGCRKRTRPRARSGPRTRPAPCVGCDTEHVGCAPQQVHVPDRFGGGDQQEASRLRAAAPASRRRKLSSMRPGTGRASGSANPPASSAAVRSRGSSSKREGVPTRLGDDPVVHARVQGAVTAVWSSARASPSRSPVDHEVRQARQLVVRARLPDGEHHRHPVREEASRDELERLRRHPVEPLGIVHEAHHRFVLGRVGHQAEHRQPDQEPIRRGALHAERRPRASRCSSGSRRGGRASARTAGAGRRTRAPSRTPRPPRGRDDTRTRRPAGSRAARTCRRPPRRAGPGPGSARRARLARAGRARRALGADHAEPPLRWCATWSAEGSWHRAACSDGLGGAVTPADGRV